MTTQEIVVPSSPKPVAVRNIYLPGYLDERTIQTLTKRIGTMLPYANKLRPEQMRALAQASLQLRLNPFVGEICYIPDSDYQTGAVYVQYAGRLRKSREQLERDGGQGAAMWDRKEEITDDAERIRLCIPSGAVAYRCTLGDSVTSKAYAAAYGAMAEAIGKVYKDETKLHAAIIAAIGQEPLTVGIGYVTAEEATEMLKTKSGALRRNQYPVAEKASKRAHVAALKKRFHFDFTTPDLDDLPAQVAQALDAVLDQAGKFVVQDTEALTHDTETNAAERRVDEMLARLDKCQTCRHTIEEHGLTGACEVRDCTCEHYRTSDEVTGEELQARLNKNKAMLGRDGSGID